MAQHERFPNDQADTMVSVTTAEDRRKLLDTMFDASRQHHGSDGEAWSCVLNGLVDAFVRDCLAQGMDAKTDEDLMVVTAYAQWLMSRTHLELSRLVLMGECASILAPMMPTEPDEPTEIPVYVITIDE